MTRISADPRSPRPAVFLDRDGTLMDEVDYCRDPSDVRVIPGAAHALTEMRAAGWLAILITNQSGIGRGRITLSEYEAVHAEFARQLENQLDAVFFCPDLPSMASTRRKPEPGMIFEAMQQFAIDQSRSWMIGDKVADVQCGINADLRTILVRTGYGSTYEGPKPDFVAETVVDALSIIVSQDRRIAPTVQNFA